MTISSDHTLFQWLEVHAAERPDQIAIQTTGSAMSYRDLAEKVRQFASGLEKLGIGKGDIVGVQLPNSPEFVIALLAVAARGAIFQTLHMPYRKAELKQLLGHSKAQAAIALSAFKDINPAAEFVDLSTDLTNLNTIISVGPEFEGTHSFETLATTPAKASSVIATDPGDEYLLLYTSGTTASPKGVPHSYRGFMGNALDATAEFEFDEDERILSLAPFSHLYGLFCTHLALARGCTNAVVPMFNPETFVADIANLAPTAIFSAPAHFAPFIAKGALSSEMFSSTKLVCLSGATVPPPLAVAVDELLENGGVIQLWGMSELQAGAYSRPSDPLEFRATSAGRASPKTELRVVDDDGKALSEGVEGALEVRGPSVFAGYLDNEAETNAAFTRDGWFRSGDLAEIMPGDYLRLTGRTKEIINRGGVKFNPVDVEVELMTLPAIEMCAIVPVPDPNLGERGCLCVQLSPGANLTLDEVTALLSEKGIAKFKWPERLEIVDGMPLTPTRKIMRAKLAASLS